MTNFFKYFLVVGLIFSFSGVVFAVDQIDLQASHTVTTGDSGQTVRTGNGGNGGIVTASKLKNPLNGINSIEGLISAILKIIVAIATPIAVLMLMYTGFKYVMARGNPGEIEKAHEMFLGTIVGILVLLGASLISEIIKGTITQLGAGIF